MARRRGIRGRPLEVIKGRGRGEVVIRERRKIFRKIPKGGAPAAETARGCK